jgi:hypothetical protein
MTTLGRTKATCFICGNASEHTTIGSTNRFGSPDLDLRPPPMMRETITYWIQRCPTCGYCADSISAGPEIAKEIVKSSGYVEQRDNPAFPALANAFLCWSLIEAADGKDAEAGWAALHAAWICDDKAAEKADFCRQKAIALFLGARSKGQTFVKGGATEALLLADLYRRSGQFDQVDAACNEGLTQQPDLLMKSLFLAQRQLAHSRDRGRHTVEEAQKIAGAQQQQQ